MGQQPKKRKPVWLSDRNAPRNPRAKTDREILYMGLKKQKTNETIVISIPAA